MIDLNVASRQRVLLIAFECSPNHGSEWANGWNRALEAAKHYDTTVITGGNQQETEIRAWLAANPPILGLRFEFLACDAFTKYPTHVGGKLWLAYRGWQQSAFDLAKELHAEQRFDMIHQVTNTGFREPGFTWQLDAPFIWGPIGGTHNYPWRFLGEAGWRGALSEGLRGVANAIQLRYSRRVAEAARRASTMLAANSTSCEQFRKTHHVQPVRMLDVGISSVSLTPRASRPVERPLRILWSGQFTPRKALSLLLKALARLPRDLSYQLRVVGGGPLEARWKQLAARLGIADRVEWSGWLSHVEARKQYDWADVFAFTSLRDNSGTVVLEALGAGVPVVCLDHQGVRDVVTNQCGIKIAVNTPRQVITDLAAAISRLANDEPLRGRLGDAALERARDYLWPNLGAQMAGIYRNVLDDAPAEPVSAELAPVLRQPRPTAKAALREAAIWSIARAASGLRAVCGPRTANDFGILTYHRIADRTPGIPAPTWNTTPEAMRSQLAGLIERGFKPWSLSAVLEARRESRPLPPGVFVVTFDDGYANNLLNALPVLESLNVPATVFLATSFLDSRSPFPFDDWRAAGSQLAPPNSWRPLTTRECGRLLESGLIELGSHTHTHRKLLNQPAEFLQDLAESVSLLQGQFGVLKPTLAFPHGITSPALVAVSREAGVVCALSTQPDLISLSSDPLCWGRFSVESHDTAATLAGKLSGWYTTLTRLMRPAQRQAANRNPPRNPTVTELPIDSCDPSNAPAEFGELVARD